MTTRLALLAFGAAGALASHAQGLPSTRDLADLSLEELVAYEVISVSKRPERLADAAASVFVITSQDIRRSGAMSLPEVLRLAPNLQVSQASANGYAIRARGVHNNSANKLLVLIDGRSTYSPLFSGVFWDVQDVMLEEIDRIEVVSGPGGTLWGVNAVNGVINVITRKASDTLGTLVSAGGGDSQSDGALRHGGTLGSNGHYRVYGKYNDRGHTRTAAGLAVLDSSHLAQAGFRADWQFARDQWTVHGNAYDGTIGQPLPGSISISGFDLALAPIPVQGYNLTAAWMRRLDNGSELSVQAYADRTERTVPPTFAERLDIYDLQLQHSTPVTDAFSFVWGGHHREGKDRVVNSEVFAFLPARLTQQWSSLFAQAELRVAPRVEVTAGARLERNSYTGNEWLPNLRVGWKPAPEQLLWSAISRTVRAPSRLDRDAFVPGQPPFLLRGGPDARSEVASVVEAGYRGASLRALSYSVTAYYAEYDHLHTQEIDPGGTFVVFAGNLEATVRGIEAWATWQAAERLRLSAGYWAQHQEFRLKPGSNDAAAVGRAALDPAHQWVVRSSYTIGHGVELDAAVRGVAALANPTVPRYWTADLRLGWRPTAGLELYVAGRNLRDGGHGEFTDVITRTQIERSVHVGFRCEFGAR